MQESFTKLRELKGEIESIQRLLEKARTKLQQEFDDWCVLERIVYIYSIYYIDYMDQRTSGSFTDLLLLRIAKDRTHDTKASCGSGDHNRCPPHEL